jgi:hypothetical protein
VLGSSDPWSVILSDTNRFYCLMFGLGSACMNAIGNTTKELGNEKSMNEYLDNVVQWVALPAVLIAVVTASIRTFFRFRRQLAEIRTAEAKANLELAQVREKESKIILGASGRTVDGQKPDDSLETLWALTGSASTRITRSQPGSREQAF